MKKAAEPIYYPVFLNLKGKQCAVIGGGRVALRKVTGLLECGAIVKVISPELCRELAELAERQEIQVVPREYRQGDLKGTVVAVAATDSSIINQKVSDEARETAVLVNVVDDAGKSDFIAPSIVRQGEITIAISTSGQSPALARKLRTRLEKEFGEEYGQLARIVGEVRTELRKARISVDSEDWQTALELDYLLELIRTGRAEQARTALLNSLKAKQAKK